MSPFRIAFDHELQYRQLLGSSFYPALVVGLVGPTGQDDVLAIIDSGAAYCLFNGVRAKSIGLNLTAGRAITLGALSGGLKAWLHRVTLDIEGYKFDCEVAFSDLRITRELLGRHELFSKARFGFREGFSLCYFHPQP